jgi:phage head maturation protease
MPDDPRPVVELRSSAIAEVKYPERIITVLAVPYEQETDRVVYKGRQVVESFARGSFSGVESRNGKVMVNREHVKGKTVGKVAAFHPDAAEGLVEDIRIAETAAGDETLALAADGMVFPSIGFAVVKGSDQEVTSNRRYIRRAFVDHMAFVEDPAYTGANVVAVRHANGEDEPEAEHLSTPRLDEWLTYVSSRRVGLSA